MLHGKKKASGRKGGFERWVKTSGEEAAGTVHHTVKLKQWNDLAGKITDVKRGEGVWMAFGEECARATEKGFWSRGRGQRQGYEQ